VGRNYPKREKLVSIWRIFRFRKKGNAPKNHSRGRAFQKHRKISSATLIKKIPTKETKSARRNEQGSGRKGETAGVGNRPSTARIHGRVAEYFGNERKAARGEKKGRKNGPGIHAKKGKEKRRGVYHRDDKKRRGNTFWMGSPRRKGTKIF